MMHAMTVEELTASKVKMHGRCLALFSKLTDAQTRIAELESIISAMRYAMRYAAKVDRSIDLEQCAVCEDCSDA